MLWRHLKSCVSAWKNKGERSNLNNDRGIFLLTIIRMIKDKMILNDIGDDVDENMSDSQVGTRKGKSIRNHIFVVNAILNAVKQKESDPIDLQIFDVEKCFDSLWLEQCCNDLWEAGIIDDKLALMYEGNLKNEVAIQTPGAALTERM